MPDPSDHVVTLVGSGQMALVAADAVAAGGARVKLWGPHPKNVRRLAETREAPQHLAGFRLPDAVEVTDDASRALDDVTVDLTQIW